MKRTTDSSFGDSKLPAKDDSDSENSRGDKDQIVAGKDQHDAESHARSDAAVAGEVSKYAQAPTRKAKDQKYASHNKPNTARKKPPPSSTRHNMTYPNPKNFAERIMGILEGRVASDMIFWAGEGKAVALWSRKIKKSPDVPAIFKVKSYTALIRNFNRWGFRRVSYYSDTVPKGVVTYQNPLFQRLNPHLVMHMRIDSDVQDLFVQQNLESSEGPETSQAQQSNSNPQASVPEAISIHHHPQFNTGNSSLQQQLMGLLTGGSLRSIHTNRPRSQITANASNNSSGFVQAGSLNPQQPAYQTPVNDQSLLDQIIRLSNHYLDQTVSESNTGNSIRTTLQFLNILVQAKSSRNQPSTNVARAQQPQNPWMSSLSQQQHQPAPALDLSYQGGSSGGQNILETLISSHGRGQNSTPSTFHQNTASLRRQLENLLQEQRPARPLEPSTAATFQFDQQQRPENNNTQQQQQQQQQQGVPDIQALLLGLLQKRQGGP